MILYRGQWRFAGWTWLLWPAVLGLCLTTLLAIIGEFRSEARAQRGVAMAIIPLIAQAAASPLATGDTEALARLARLAMRQWPQIAELEIRGGLGEQLAYARTPRADPGLLGSVLSTLDQPVDVRMTLEASPKPVAEIEAPSPPTVHLVMHPTSNDPRVMHRLRRFLLSGLIGLLAVGAASAYALMRVALPQRKLLEAARQLGQGRLEARAPSSAPGMTGEIAEAINLVGRKLLEMQDRGRGWLEQETSRLKRELTDERTRLRQLERNVEETQSDARTRSELYAQISHELRTPLASIIGYSVLLGNANLPGASAEHVETLSKSAHGLLVMVNDLLDWSRIEAGRLQLNEAPFDLEDCVDDVVNLLAPLAYDKRLELVHILYHDVPRELIGDSQRIQQVLTNLISNAIKFTETGEVVVRVMKEREEPRSLTLVLRVSDTGVGMTPDQQRRLFQPYQQVGGRPGSGLGLVITRKLAELMGGNVTLESAPGQGTTFSASLTLARQTKPSTAKVFDGLRDCSVWVCEPHATARLALLHSLEYWGVQVRELGSVAELRDAIERAGANRPDLALLGLSAGEAEGQARADSNSALPALRRHGVPVLCLVASISQKLHEGLRQAGATRCLPKSTGRSTLYQNLRELISGDAVVANPLAGRRVLVADNNLPNRRYIVAMLQGLGAATDEAADGDEAVARWFETRPDGVLLDVHMPGMDGIAAAREIRAREGGGARSLIIGISAYLDPSERRALALAGMDGDLIKPFDERQLLRLLAPRASAPLPTAQPTTRVADRLAQDRELQDLLRSELPLQLRELEEAFAAGVAQRLRDAAHQVHGPAAFYRLAGLKQAAAALAARIADSSTATAKAGPLKVAMAAVREAVVRTLQELPKG